MLHFLKLLVQLLLAPKNGWEDIHYSQDDERTVFLHGFLPMLAICACSGFIQKLYHHDLAWVLLTEKAIVAYAALFSARYFAEFMFSLLLLRDIRTSLNRQRIQLFIMYTLSIIALMLTMINCVPFSPVLILLPLYSIVVMRMGTGFMKVIPDRIGHFMFLSIGSIFAPVFLIIFLFGLLLN